MTIRSLLEESAGKTPSAPALVYKHDGWKTMPYGDFLARVRETAEGYGTLFNLVPQHDNVALILPNRPEWMISYLACAGAGVSVVPADPKLHNEETLWILSNSEASVVTTDAAHVKMLQELQPSLPALRGIVIVGEGDVPEEIGGVTVRRFEDLARKPEPGDGFWFDANVAREDDVASIIYTSGTTGRPKGAMMTHANFTADAEGAYGAFSDPVSSRDSFFVVLPLFHAFSFCTNFVVPMMRGCAMMFNESLRTIGEDMRELRPTIVMAVPLLVEKMYDRINGKIQSSFTGRALMKLGLGRLVGRNVRKGLGGKIMCIVVGGAPCPVHVLQGFRKLGIPLLQGYGLTECSPVVSIAGPRAAARIGTIGYKLTNIEVRLADKNENGIGELQIRGPITMQGYWKNEQATKEAFDEGGWLRTGDLAEIGEDGLLTIKGRKKALIVNREGKNIYPEEVENRIASDKITADCVVVGYKVGNVEGDGERVGAIIHPDIDLYKESKGGEPSWNELEKWTVRRVQELCADLADYKRPRKIVVSKEPLERTSIQKVRRVAYQNTLDE